MMSININNQAPQKNIVIEQNKTQKQTPISKEGVPVSAIQSDDSVELTAQAQSLNNMQASEPEVNKQRVETLKAAIMNGDYKINTERLAEKMSKFEGDFGKTFG